MATQSRKRSDSKWATPGGEIHYSDKIKGDAGNFDQSVQFDAQRGYIGITQYDGETVRDRVLLTPAQMKALKKFADRRQ